MGITRQEIDREETFDRIVLKHQAQVQRFALRMLDNDSDTAEDVTVAVFVKLWQNWDRIETESDVHSWLLRCAYRLSVDCLRRRQELPLNDSLACENGLQEDTEVAATMRAVRQAIGQLSERNRAVLILTVYEELSYQETADALEIPNGTVASRRSEAIRQLKTQLGPWMNQ